MPTKPIRVFKEQRYLPGASSPRSERHLVAPPPASDFPGDSAAAAMAGSEAEPMARGACSETAARHMMPGTMGADILRLHNPTPRGPCLC
eukprot:CAMPEP_0115264092 /NCGR_PEP_ID=MMETSP0270-20121206/50250_1 /TAXON_ID=71861 /ORGANISM="Scrippsiella trochoidea, Strain CCMP3099" /LENGTH=89 /DNA_ID=CAMNT_0002680099 /DNA_START=198 /DNA_END=464 /DNA_ORIENTATION=+